MTCNPTQPNPFSRPPFVQIKGAIVDCSAYSMGLFLQKTNIIRDYREDLDDKRKFWPRAVWSKYADDLSDFADAKNLDAVLMSVVVWGADR
jgi:phytoene/squalene synthetase